MKTNLKLQKKIIMCFTGEPRSFSKGLKSRTNLLNKSNIYKFEIESRYLISFSNEYKKSNNKLRILKSLKNFNQDKNLKSIKLTDGDRIFVPKRPTSVTVIGEVMTPGSLIWINKRSS